MQELQALIKYIEINKAGDLDWFTIKPSNKEGTHWSGKCWCVMLSLRHVLGAGCCNPRAGCWVWSRPRAEHDLATPSMPPLCGMLPSTGPRVAPLACDLRPSGDGVALLISRCLTGKPAHGLQVRA